MINKKAIKVEEESFTLIWESLELVDLAQSYVHLKIAKNDQKWLNYVDSG